jgi:hypothetical protein
MGYPPVQLYYPAPQPLSYKYPSDAIINIDIDNRCHTGLLISHNTAFATFKESH